MNHVALLITGQMPIFLSSPLSESDLIESLNRTLTVLWKERERRLLHNYYVLHPEEYVGEEKRRPLTKLTTFNEFFKVGNNELALNMFYNFDTREAISWSVKKIHF